MTISVMGIYAVLWQKVLSIIPLNRAYLYKSSGIIISLMYAYIFFGEEITVKNILGALMIVIGILILSYKQKTNI